MLLELTLLVSIATAPAAPAPARVPTSGPAFEPVPLDPPIEPSPEACSIVLGLLNRAIVPREAVERLRAIGRQAARPIGEGLAQRPGVEEAIALLEALASVGDFQQDAIVRPYLFAEDPDVATAATFALARIDGARASPTLEFLLRSKRPLGQTLLAIEQVAGFALPSSFPDLQRIADDSSQPPELRAAAARNLPAIDVPRTRKWLKGLHLPAGTSAFFQAEVDRLLATLGTSAAARDKTALR